MNLTDLQVVKDSLLEQESYEMFDRLLLKQQPFKAKYRPQISRQSSQNLHHFNNHYDT